MTASHWLSPRMAPARAAIFLLALLASYLAAPHLPITAGWENGPVENLQAAALFAGGVLALWWRARASDARARAFWLIVAPIWFVLCARELSWGTVFMAPLEMSAQDGPTFSSSRQLPYKALVAPAIGLLLLAQAWLFVRTRQHRTFERIWAARAFPWLEIGLFAIAMLVSTEAEGHGFIGLDGMAHGARQALEELAELMAYVALLLAQWRVAHGLRQAAPVPGS